MRRYWFTATENTFYIEGVNDANMNGDSLLPADAVEVDESVFSEYSIQPRTDQRRGADDTGKPVWDDLPAPSLDTLKDAKKREIETSRIETERQGVPYTFPSGSDDIIQTRNDTDFRNVNGQVSTALILGSQGVTDAVIDFRAGSNTTYHLTPSDMIAMGTAVSQCVQVTYTQAWALKDQVDQATTPDEVAAIEWPV